MAECSPDKWKQHCSEKHLLVISQEIAQWQDIAPFLGLTDVDVADIIVSHPRSLPAQRLAMLKKWNEKLGVKATYKKLARALRSCGRQDLVDKISELLTEDSSSSSDEAGVLFIDTQCIYCSS